jgi:DNA-binding CsgD family transcriptional regulator
MQSPRPDLDAVLSSLTARERQIVDYVAAGRPNKVIAIDLGISLRTVEAHRARIFAKLDSRNAMQLACRLCAHGRSGASPIVAALKGGAGMPPATPAGAALSYVLHEPAAASARGLAEPHESNPDTPDLNTSDPNRSAPNTSAPNAPDPNPWPTGRPK